MTPSVKKVSAAASSGLSKISKVIQDPDDLSFSKGGAIAYQFFKEKASGIGGACSAENDYWQFGGKEFGEYTSNLL